MSQRARWLIPIGVFSAIALFPIGTSGGCPGGGDGCTTRVQTLIGLELPDVFAIVGAVALVAIPAALVMLVFKAGGRDRNG